MSSPVRAGSHLSKEPSHGRDTPPANPAASDEPLGAAEAAPRRDSWWTLRAWLAHVAFVVWVPGCVVACRWQIDVALSGNSLGWAYAVMWPCFAVFGVVVWWHVIHDDPETVGRRGLRRLVQTTQHSPPDVPRLDTIEQAEAEDPALASYNAYLAQLARDQRPRTWRRR